MDVKELNKATSPRIKLLVLNAVFISLCFRKNLLKSEGVDLNNQYFNTAQYLPDILEQLYVCLSRQGALVAPLELLTSLCIRQWYYRTAPLCGFVILFSIMHRLICSTKSIQLNWNVPSAVTKFFSIFRSFFWEEEQRINIRKDFWA